MTSYVCCRQHHDGDPPPISHFPNSASEQACQITDLDANIQRIDDTIVALIKQRSALSRKRNALVPAINLPPEVLAMIFEFACHSIDLEYYHEHGASYFDSLFKPTSNLGQPSYDKITTTPSLIGTVCSVWRTIVMGTSQLWSNIGIIFNEANVNAQAAKLRYWISKSGQCPLNVSVVEEFNDLDEDIGLSSTVILDVLEAYAHRLQTLQLFLPEAWEKLPAIDRIARCLPMLTRIALYPGNNFHYIQNFDLFNLAPKLREVRLCACSTTTVSLPLEQLEHLEVVETGKLFSEVDECLDRLRLCPCLRGYVANLNSRNPLAIVPALAPLTHSTLEVIELVDTNVGPAGIQAFLEPLTLPMLRSFSVITYRTASQGSPSLLPFLSRSGEKLETLCLAGSMPSEEELLGYLRVLPQLRKLVLNNNMDIGFRLTQRTLDLMNPAKYEGMGLEAGQNGGDKAGTESDERAGGLCLSPNLETLYYQGPIESTPHALVEFLADRWYGPPTESASSDALETQSIMGPEVRTVRRTEERLPPRLNVPSVRLRSVAFKTNVGFFFDDADAAVLERLQQEGMDVFLHDNVGVVSSSG